MLGMRRSTHSSLVAWATAGLAVAQSGWFPFAPATSPPARAYCGITHDIVRGATVLFGGWNSSYFGDTWEWNGINWTLRTSTNAPSPRLAHAMAYDVARGRVVLFGGAVGSGAGVDSDETWEWDGINWIQLQPALRPSPRRGVDMTYDLARNVTVLFGGGLTASGTPVYDDTWEWNGSTWTQRSPATVPPARWNSYLVSDWARGNVVMFGGGVGATPQYFADTWIWDGTDWQLRSPAASPSPRRYGGGAYDAQRGLVVIFGGLTSGGSTNETWLWDGTDWRNDASAPGPGGRFAMGMAHDLVRNRNVTFGGNTSPGIGQETWEYVPITLAQWTPAGAGCAGPAGTPVLAPLGSSLPQLGTTFSLRLAYGTGNGVGLMAVGLSNQAWSGGSLPINLGLLGMPGCQWFTSTDWVGSIVLTNGVGTLPWVLPAAPSFAGLRFYAQGLVLDPAANPFGAVVSASGAGLVGF